MTDDREYLSDFEGEIDKLRAQIREFERLAGGTSGDKQKSNGSNWHSDLIIHNSPDCIAIYDLNGGLIDANPAYCRMLGYSLDELLCMKISDLEAKEDPEETAHHIEAIRKHEGDRFETRLRRKDGTIIDVDVSSNVCEINGRKCLIGFQHDITARKQAEEALKENEEKYRTLVEMSPHAIAIIQDGKVAFANQSAVQLFAVESPAPIFGRDAFDVIAPHERERLRGFAKRRYKGDPLLPGRYRSELVRVDGRIFPAELFSTRIIYKGLPSIQVMAIDITEQEEAAGALRESEKKYRDLVEQINAVTYTALPDNYSSNVYISPQINALIGFSSEEMVADPALWLKRIHPDDVERVNADMADCYRTGQSLSIEYRIIAKDGTIRWIKDEAIIKCDNAGRPVTVHGIMIDISRIKEAEETLATSEKRYEQLINSALEGIIILGLDTILQFCNLACAKLFDIDNPLDLIGRSTLDFVEEDQKSVILDNLKLRKKGISTQYELNIITARKNRKTLLVSSAPLFDETGNITSILSTCIDITERKKLEKIQSALISISGAVSFAGSLEELIARIRDAIGCLIDVSNCYVALWNDENNLYSFPFFVDTDGSGPYQPMRLQYTLTDYVRKTGQPLLADAEVQEKLRQSGEFKIDFEPPKSWLGVPLKVSERVIGVVAVQTYRDSDFFTGNDLKVLSMVSGHIGMAIERKRAEEALRSSEEFNRAVIEHLPVGVSVRSRTGKLLGCNKAWQKVWNKTDNEIKKHLALESPELQFTKGDDYIKEWQPKIRAIYEHGDYLHIPEAKLLYNHQGGEHWVSQYFYGLKDRTGAVEKVIILTEDISERKQAEEARLESDRRFRDLFQHFTSGYVIGKTITDDAGQPIDFVCLEVNEAFEKLAGKCAGEVVGKKVTEIFPSAHETSLIKAFGEVALTGKPTIIEHKSLVPGKLFEVLIYSTRQGEFATVFTDITEKKQAENALRESEERFRAMWENSPVGICMLDCNGIYYYVNRTYCSIYGYTPEELVGKPFYELISPRDKREAHRDDYKRKFGRNKSAEVSEAEVFVKKSGESVAIQYTNDYIMQDGSVKYEVTMNIDVTAKKQAEDALRESEEKYRLLVENAGEIIANINREGKFLHVNKAAARYFDKSPSDFIGKTLFDFFPSEIAGNYLSSVQRVLDANENLTVERMITLRGERIWFRANLQPVIGGDGRATGVIIITRDITLQKQAEIRNQARLALLQRLRQAHDVSECLKFGCQAIFEAELFKRAVLTLHDDNRQITDLGQVGLDEEVVASARKGSAPDLELTRRLMHESQRISHSFFVPVESGLMTKGWERYVPQPEATKTGPEMWRAGDELFVPLVGNDNKYEGWLSVDTPFNGKRPTNDIVVILEEILDITSKQVHGLQSLERLKLESQALQNKNITLREVLASIEDEKMEIRQRIGNNVSQILIPAFNKLVKKDGTLNNTYYNILKAGLPDLVTASGAAVHMYSSLSPREREICNMIKSNSTSKEIASSLNISLATVQKHRELIRRKLGLINKDINLVNYLKGI